MRSLFFSRLRSHHISTKASLYMLKKLLRYLPTTLMKSSNWFSFFCYWCQLHSSELTVIEFGDWPFWHIFLSALRTNSLRFQAFLSPVFCLHQMKCSSSTQFSPLLLFPITKYGKYTNAFVLEFDKKKNSNTYFGNACLEL